MKRKSAFSVVVIVALVMATAIFFFQAIRLSGMVLHGSFFVSDAGRSHGGFVYNAEWNATLTLEGRDGVLKLSLNVGLGDALEKHEFQVSDFAKDAGKMSMRIDGQPVVLIWQENDPVWGHAYDRYYVASWGGDAPLEEIRGTISPLIFPGLAPHHYVEMRLK